MKLRPQFFFQNSAEEERRRGQFAFGGGSHWWCRWSWGGQREKALGERQKKRNGHVINYFLWKILKLFNAGVKD